MRRCRAALAVVVAAAVLVGPVTGPAVAGPSPGPVSSEAVPYRPPVDAPLRDDFRPPATLYGAGNRGIDYGTEEGQTVTAAAAGEVVFAGRVGADLHVVVLHADGIRTSYSFLSAVSVRRGDRVEAGDVVGSAGAAGLHFGARSGDNYLDPLALLGLRHRRVHLVADPDAARPLAEVHERLGLVDSLRGIGRSIGTGGEATWRWLERTVKRSVNQKIDLALVLMHDAISLGIPAPVHLLVAALAWDEEQAGCTAPDAAVPPPPPGRRIAVLVGGLASSTGHSAVLDVRTGALGYSDADVHQFSYRPDGQPYGPADTAGDIAQAGEVLAAQVERLRRGHPNAVVDVIGHSMGGLVARAAITIGRARGVAVVVTLATPHRGADLATAAVALDSTTSGHAVAEGVGWAGLGPVDPNAPSILQMSETSDFLARLPDDGWAPTRVVSVAARWDIFVPNTQSRLGGATNVVVSPYDEASVDDHGRLPGSPEATREIGLALAGLGPTCRAFPDRFQDWSGARDVSMVTDVVSASLAIGGIWLDAKNQAALVKAVKDAVRRP